MLDRITPVVLTLNESPNIGRMLARLAWARDIVLVDSFSDDDTLDIARKNVAVRIFQRRFDNHAAQWQYAISETGIATEWVLALDADFVLTDELIAEMRALTPRTEIVGYRASFTYCMDGQPLRGSLYPPVTVLFRRADAHYVQDGHTQRVQVSGEVGDLQGHILHDDRKPLAQWLAGQARYARLEAERLGSPVVPGARLAERVRRLRVVAPFAVLFYCLFAKGLLLDGWPGIAYSLQRAYAELLLSRHLLERDFRRISMR